MPGTQQLRETASVGADGPTPSTEQPETTQLWLPSSMPRSLRLTGCITGLVRKEQRLRLAQADDTLHELRRQLRISATLLDYKKANIGGTSQRMGTRARTLMARFHHKTLRCARRYDAAFKALTILDPDGEWATRLQLLVHSRDLHLPRRDREEDPSEGRREISWIRLASHPSATSDDNTSDEYNDGKSYQLYVLLLIV